MAEKVEIDIPGIGLIEAKNAASEATLQEILKVMQGTQKAVQQQSKNQGKGGNSGGAAAAGAAGGAAAMTAFNKQAQTAAKGLNVLGIAGKTVGAAFNVVGKTAGIAVGGFNRMAAGAGMAAGATVTLGQKALAAGESMTDLIERMANVGDSTVAAAQALRVIPGVGGVLANVLGAVAGAVEKTVQSYQTAASVGATFGGSVNDMARAASGAGMTLDQFAGLVKNNAESLMMLGGTTEAGAKQFAQLSKEIQGSQVGSELQRLGYTTEQINGGMARYIGILGKTGALQGMNTQQLVAASGSYMKELDALAKITGVSREEKEKEQARLMADAKVRAAMAGLDADQQRQMMAYITSFPKEQQAAIADMIATGNTTTEEAIQLQSLLPGVAQRTMEFGRTLQAGGKINQDALNQAKNSAILEAQESVKRNKMRGMFDEQAGKQYVGAAELAAQKVDGYSQAIGEQGKAAAQANLAENLTKAKQRLAEFSNSFQMALANSGMLDSLLNVFQTLGNFVLTVIVPVFKIFADALNTVIPAVTGFLVPAFNMLGAFIQDTIVPAFQILGAWVQDGLMPIFTSLWEKVGGVIDTFSGLMTSVFGTTDVIEGVFEPALYAISDFIEDNLEPVLATLAVVAIPAVIAKMATMAASMITTIAQFIAMNLPMIGFTVAVGALMYAFKKFGVDLGVVTDALKWAGSWISTLFLKLQYGIYSLLNKIPGMRGDFDDDLKSISEKMTENEKDRAKLEQDMADRRQANLKKEEDKESARENRDKARAERREKREKDAIDRKEKREIGAIDAKEEREKAAEAKDVTVDMADPIQMLKTFANQQKSAFTQEAKALDDKEKARSELKMASDEYNKAMEQAGKASNDLERKAAEERVKAAEERLQKANKTNVEADEAVKKAAERMKAAKEGKDPGAVAAGKPKEEKKAETAKPEAGTAAGKPAGPEKEVSQDAQKNLALIKAAMEKQGLSDPKYIAATLGNVMKESGGKARSENLDYSKTSNERIKSIFGSRASGKSDKELDEIKKDPQKMGEMMYGSDTKIGKAMGNTEPGDGWKYRGRGFIQLTGKSNYAAASKAIYGDNRLVENPDLANDPAVAAEISAWYMKKGQKSMAGKMGIDTGNMTQEQANLLATSQIAGKDVRQGGAYLKGEVMDKVNKYAASGQIQAIAGGKTPAEAQAAVAGGKPKPETTGTATAAEAKPEGKPTATAEARPSAGDSTSTTPMQSLIKDGIVPTTIAFQDLVSKGLKPFQGMVSGMQVKTPLDKGTVKPEESLGKGEEIVKSQTETQKAMSELATNMTKTRGVYDKAAGEFYLGATSLASTSSDWYTAGDSMVLNLTDSMRSTMDESFDWFGTDLSNTFASIDNLENTFNSSIVGFDSYTKQIEEAQKQIGIGEANIAQQEEAIATAAASLTDPSVTNKEEIQAAVDAMRQNIEAQKETIAYNKDVIDKNIMARAETPLTELIAQAEKDAAEKQRSAEEALQKEKDSMSTTMAGAQEGGAGGGIDLNTALAELIAINKRTADLNERQLSVQSQLSGDLFA